MRKKLLLSVALLLGSFTALFAQNTVAITSYSEIVAPVGGEHTIVATYTATEAVDILFVLREEASPYRWYYQGAANNLPAGENLEAGIVLGDNNSFWSGEPLTDSTDAFRWFVYITPTGQSTSWNTNDSSPLITVDTSAEALSVSKVDSKNNFMIFPNPVKSQFNVNLPEAGTVQVISLNGKVLMTNKVKTPGVTTLNIENLSTGVYLCRYTSANTTKTLKLVKQ